MNIIYFLIIGLIAGWLAGLILKGKGFGLVVNLIIGCIGAVLGGYLFALLNITGGLIVQIIAAVVGAIILLWVISFFNKKKK